jgi:hypothetical protein
VTKSRKPKVLPTHRICMDCLVEYPLTEDFFYGKNKNPDAYYPHKRCKDCDKKAVNRRRGSTPYPHEPKTHKVCTICSIEFPWTAELFYKAGSRDGKSYLSVRCKPCQTEATVQNRIKRKLRKMGLID